MASAMSFFVTWENPDTLQNVDFCNKLENNCVKDNIYERKYLR